MLLIVVLVSLGMHGIATAASLAGAEARGEAAPGRRSPDWAPVLR
ncbi:hypothetical protein [Ramlibacter sp.]|nr:hypothetical protein [Ramlibacter sp.]HWI82459.1 hypothetical protein [Ramlibacter sp.]